MNPETALRILRELLADYHRRGGTGVPDHEARRAPNFDEWLLRHIVADMLNRRTSWFSAYSATQINRVVFHSVQEYTPSTDGGAHFVRIRYVASDGFQQRSFTLQAVRQGTGCGFHIATGRDIGPTTRGEIAENGSVTTGRGGGVSPRRTAPVPGRGAGRHPHH